MTQQLNTVPGSVPDLEKRVAEILQEMTLAEKIGQLSLVNGTGGQVTEAMRQLIAAGGVGGILNEVKPDVIAELQEVAAKESRLGIPLLMGRDIIHGFKTIFPIPLGLAATWNPEIVRQCGRVAAVEASATGLNWTFAPVVDVCRDPRWGRIAETFGEDTFLNSKLAKAMILGFQGSDLSAKDAIGACAKHFAGYGASESGKDYNTTNVPENELRNVHLPPFKAAVDVGVMSLMTSFSDIDGVPASANEFLLKQILRLEWEYDGFVVSDWSAISQLKVHGLTADDRESAFEAANAGLDMEMSSKTYQNHLEQLLNEDRITIEQIDTMVSNILRAKLRLGLFEKPGGADSGSPAVVVGDVLKAARQAILQSCVLLENENQILPLARDQLNSLAIIGPMADEPYEQLGTWIFDGDVSLSRTPLRAIKDFVGADLQINYVKGLENTRSKCSDDFDEVMQTVEESDVVLMFVGEESILSGEAHCRSDISLPGCQERLIEAVSERGKPVVLVVMAGRPLLLEKVRDRVDAILYAWHPGCMAGPAISDLLFGVESPSGKLPVTFPRVMGQIPIYYAHKNTGRPGTAETIVHIDDIETGAIQHSVGNTSFHLDAENTPLYRFGYGLSYAKFEYSDLNLSRGQFRPGESITVTVQLGNVGPREAEEVVQLYVRDLVGSVTRPVRELKGFQRVRVKPAETRTVTFELSSDDLAFYNRQMQLTTEPGKFHLWVGGCSDTRLQTEFELTD